jgi:hypothetical protein
LIDASGFLKPGGTHLLLDDEVHKYPTGQEPLIYDEHS